MDVFDCECGKCRTRIARFYGKMITKTAVQCPECQEINNISPPLAGLREARHVEVNRKETWGSRAFKAGLPSQTADENTKRPKVTDCDVSR